MCILFRGSSKVHIGKHLSDEFPILNNKELLCHHSLSTLLYAIRKVQENKVIGIEWDTSASGLC
jgi:hypothetical protein